MLATPIIILIDRCTLIKSLWHWFCLLIICCFYGIWFHCENCWLNVLVSFDEQNQVWQITSIRSICTMKWMNTEHIRCPIWWPAFEQYRETEPFVHEHLINCNLIEWMAAFLLSELFPVARSQNTHHNNWKKEDKFHWIFLSFSGISSIHLQQHDITFELFDFHW